MPELPEVEIAARQLAAWTAGRRLLALELVDPKVLRSAWLDPAGAALGRPRRRGKFLILPHEHGELVLHFRMTGKVVPARGSPFTRARLALDDGTTLAFEDARRLGELWLLPPGGADRLPGIAAMGPEIWPGPTSGAAWARHFVGARGPIKPALMDQGRVAGLGNIAACEILFRAALSPLLPANALDAAAWERVASAAQAYLDEVIARDGGDEVLYLSLDGGENPFAVYGRGGEPCLRCGTTLTRFEQAGRGTWACPQCQGVVIK